MPKAVTYLRVSTAQQAKSGLGIEGQREALKRFTELNSMDIASEHVEVEGGNGFDALDKRPQLAAAIAQAKLIKCLIVVSRLDSLSRDIILIEILINSSVNFMVVDLGSDIDSFIIKTYASLAEKEYSLILERPKATLTVAMAKGKVLGVDRGYVIKTEHRLKGIVVRQNLAKARIARVLPVIKELKSKGFDTLQAIADEMNRRGISTARGGKWYPSSVNTVIRSKKI